MRQIAIELEQRIHRIRKIEILICQKRHNILAYVQVALFERMKISTIFFFLKKK